MLTEPPLNPLLNREKMAEYMFEKFSYEAIKIEYQATLALFARGLMTGVVMDSGEGVSHCIPIYDGKIEEHAIRRINIAGRRITDYLMRLLNIRGYNHLRTEYDHEIVRMIKEKYCYVSLNIREDR